MGAKPGLTVSSTAQRQNWFPSWWSLPSVDLVIHSAGLFCFVSFPFVLSAYLVQGKLVTETKFHSCPHGVCKLSSGEVNCLPTIVVGVAIRA